ncbi:MAG: hypothetical protein OEQ47_18300, partial [Acidimicrobiia bacterium]|nr:hypothetical protein [Acidimicrobiia bacterium]
MIVELLRLLVTLIFTAAGYLVGGLDGDGLLGNDFGPVNSQLIGAVIGAGLGYVGGGVFGRGFMERLDTLPQRLLPRASGPDLFAGGFGMVVGVLVGVVLSAPVIGLMPGPVAWPLSALSVVVFASFSA